MPCSQKTKQNTKQTQYCSKINKDFKNGPHQKDLLKKSSIRDELLVIALGPGPSCGLRYLPPLGLLALPMSSAPFP